MSHPDFNIESNLFVQRAMAVLRSKKCVANAAGIKLITELEAELEFWWQRTAIETVWHAHWGKFKLYSLEPVDIFPIKVFLSDHFEGHPTRIEIREQGQAVAVSVDIGPYQLDTLVRVVAAPPKRPRKLKQNDLKSAIQPTNA